MDRDIYHDDVLFGRGTLLASHRGLSHTARRFCASVSDVEVLTMVICGAFFKLRRDTDLCASFWAHSRSFFPALTGSHALCAASRQPRILRSLDYVLMIRGRDAKRVDVKDFYATSAWEI